MFIKQNFHKMCKRFSYYYYVNMFTNIHKLVMHRIQCWLENLFDIFLFIINLGHIKYKNTLWTILWQYLIATISDVILRLRVVILCETWWNSNWITTWRMIIYWFSNTCKQQLQSYFSSLTSAWFDVMLLMGFL